MAITKLLILLSVCLCFSSLSTAGIYKWVDENGKVHFSDKKPVSQGVEEVDVRVNTYESVSYDTSLFDVGKQVVMYSASWCGYCKQARQYFKKNGIRYTEHDIEKNRFARKKYDELGATGVPVILVGKKRMNGFSEAGFRRIYEQ